MNVAQIWNKAIRAAADAAARPDKRGREWVPGSLWDTIKRETQRDILTLIVEKNANDEDRS